MIHFLRTANNKTVVDVSATKDDLSVVIIIEEYTKFVMLNNEKWLELIRDFGGLQELRGEYHEHPSMTKANGKHPETPDEFVARRLKEVGGRWYLSYVTD